MAHPEQGLEIDQDQQARTLSNEAAQRIVFRLVSIRDEPLSRDNANVLSRVIQGDKKHPEHELTFTEGSYFLDFNAPEEEDMDASLASAVEQTDAALSSTMIPAEIAGAWTFPADAPAISKLTAEGWEDLSTDVSDAAKALFVEHHTKLLDDSFDRLLFSV